LGKDPEYENHSHGDIPLLISLATSERFKGQNGENGQEHTDWHHIVLWDKLGEIAINT
jgi:single-stranded DNA-binding protein